MRLTDHESAMLAGAEGPARQFAMQQIVKVGRFFDAADTVGVSQVHIMADPEALGPSGVTWLETIANLPPTERRVTRLSRTRAASISPPTSGWARPTPWPTWNAAPPPPSRRWAC